VEEQGTVDEHWLAALGNSIHRTSRCNRPELFDAVVADGDVPVIEVDGRVAMAGDEAELVAEAEPIGGARDAETACASGRPLVGGGRFVADEQQATVEGERLEAGVDDRAVLRRVAHHRRPDEQARLERPRRRAIAVEIAAVIGVPFRSGRWKNEAIGEKGASVPVVQEPTR
jgi:hypothetical protein